MPEPIKYPNPNSNIIDWALGRWQWYRRWRGGYWWWSTLTEHWWRHEELGRIVEDYR